MTRTPRAPIARSFRRSSSSRRRSGRELLQPEDLEPRSLYPTRSSIPVARAASIASAVAASTERSSTRPLSNRWPRRIRPSTRRTTNLSPRPATTPPSSSRASSHRRLRRPRGSSAIPSAKEAAAAAKKCAVISGALACTTPFGTLGAGKATRVRSRPMARAIARRASTCMTDGCGSRCYAYCADRDCPTSACTRDAGGGQKVCDVPVRDVPPHQGSDDRVGAAASKRGLLPFADRRRPDLLRLPLRRGRHRRAVQAVARVRRRARLRDPTGGNNFQKCHQVCALGGATTCIGGGSASR